MFFSPSPLTTFCTSLVGSDDGHEELLAAAEAVINPGAVFTREFIVFNILFILS